MLRCLDLPTMVLNRADGVTIGRITAHDDVKSRTRVRSFGAKKGTQVGGGIVVVAEVWREAGIRS